MGPAGADESDLLESGEVDAIFHAGEPRAYIQGHPSVGRLFSDCRFVEREYYSKTGIFPIMHAVAIKKSLVKKDPQLVEVVFNTYSQSKRMAFDYVAQAAWIKACRFSNLVKCT